MDHDSACDERKQEDSDITLNVNQQQSEDGLNQQTSSSEFLNRDNGENMEQGDVQNSDPAEERTAPPSGGLLADDSSCGDNNGVTPIDKESKVKVGFDDTGEGKVPETTTSSTEGDKNDDSVDGIKASLNEETTAVKDTNTETREDDGRGLVKDAASKAEKDDPESTTFLQTNENLKEEKSTEEKEKDVEIIGPTTEEETKHSVPKVTDVHGDSDPAEERTVAPSGGRPSLLGEDNKLNVEKSRKEQIGTLTGELEFPRIGIIVAVFIAALAAMLLPLLQPEAPQRTLQQIEIFHQEMEKVKSKFPNQRPELWKRSKIHLERHLNTTQPTEPVSLILTALPGAERTLRCLAQGLAFTFSSALNASVLHIDGASKASQDSDEVKLDIDQQLRAAFEGDKPVAVIHRFEELPPGSTLIFYRYCDHENAAYKKTFLIFTVLLEEENEDLTKTRLSNVEEMVDDHLQKKFISHGHPVAFDRMDLDKYGGLWSRISHLILPVAADKNIEHGRCQWT